MQPHEMKALRPELSHMPARIARLPIHRGYPVPWFVDLLPDGTPEFRAADPRKFARAIQERRCWVCGDYTGATVAFVIGPMCAINRTSSEPPCHYECAAWSAINCPFLSRPRMVRRENELPEDLVCGDASIDRNPGCAGVWVTKGYRVFKAGTASATGYLLTIGEPLRVEWYAEGRTATRAEVERSIETGLPFLLEQCNRERSAMARYDARAALKKACDGVGRLLPAA